MKVYVAHILNLKINKNKHVLHLFGNLYLQQKVFSGFMRALLNGNVAEHNCRSVNIYHFFRRYIAPKETARPVRVILLNVTHVPDIAILQKICMMSYTDAVCSL